MIKSFLINKYLGREFIKIVISTSIIFFALGFIMNLFEEINFFKDLDVSFVTPIALSLLFTPSLLHNFFPFIILLSGIWFFLKIKKNDELTAINISGISNLSIITIPGILSIILGILFMAAINPVTSVLVKKYEIIKGSYELDQEYLAAITENGIWIKEKNLQKNNIVRAAYLDNESLMELTIYEFDKDNDFVRRVEAESANIKSLKWSLKNVTIINSEGIIASDNIDDVIKLIRASKNADEARENLMSKYKLSEIQSKAIVEMRLRQLTGLEQDKLRNEYNEIKKLITDLKDILDTEDRRMKIITDELIEVRKKYGDERRSRIEYSGGDLSIEDMIPDEKVVITISHAGYIKRTPLDAYRVQNRGGVGQKASTTRNEDFLEKLFIGTNHQYMLFFTQKGKCFWMRVFEIPEGSRTSKGRAIQNLISIEQEDRVKAFICTQDLKNEEYINSHYVIMATKKGQVKKTSLEKYSRPRANGINAITIREGDELLHAKLTNGNSQIFLAVKSGKAIRFEEGKTRPMGRNASGVRGIRLANENDELVGMVSVNDMDTNILVVSQNGFGKRSNLEDYRITNRGGKGVKTISITEKTGDLVTIKNVTDLDDLMIINKSGIAIRIAVSDLRVMGRATQGVKLINIKENDSIAAVAKVMKDDEEVEDVNEIEVEDGTIVK